MAELSLRDGLLAKGRDAFLAQLHDEAPLFRGPSGFWVASRFEDVRAILLDHEHFSSSAMAGGGLGFGFPLLTDDPPHQTKQHTQHTKTNTPTTKETMRPY